MERELESVQRLTGNTTCDTFNNTGATDPRRQEEPEPSLPVGRQGDEVSQLRRQARLEPGERRAAARHQNVRGQLAPYVDRTL